MVVYMATSPLIFNYKKLQDIVIQPHIVLPYLFTQLYIMPHQTL